MRRLRSIVTKTYLEIELKQGIIVCVKHIDKFS